MEKAIEARIGGRKLTLIYTVRVMLDVMAKYGGEQELLDKMRTAGAEAGDTAAWLFCRMAEEGNRWRSLRGRNPAEVPEAEELMMECSPTDFLGLQKAALDAFTAGHQKEVPEEEEEDEGLREFEKKTEKRRRKPTSTQ